MKLVKSLLLGSVAGFAVVAGAQAADLPSRKAAPASYVKICDAYGAGFFYIPGTDTCLKVGGRVRADYFYAPGQAVYTYGAANTVAQFATPVQVSGAQNTTGMEVRGRIDLDARTPTAWGTARTFIQLRGANTSGIRNDATNNNAAVTISTASATALTIESAMVQWAGFTFGIGPSNYAFMPTSNYTGSAFTQFPTGAKQLAYTATFGGGFSATLAIEDRNDWGYSSGTAQGTYLSRLDSAYNIVGNVRIDQSWGFAVLHGAIGNNSYQNTYALSPAFGATPLGGAAIAYSPLAGQSTTGSYAIGATVKFNLPMLAAGDNLFLTANYTRGMLGALLQPNGNSSISGGAGNNQKYLLGGITRVDSNVVVTGGNGSLAAPYTVGSTTGWNVAASFLHYWAANWRSQFTAGYVEFNPPTSTLTQWGKARMYNLTGNIIFSPVKDFDIGLELQYENLKNSIQNPAVNYLLAGSPGLSVNNWTTRLRIQRDF